MTDRLQQLYKTQILAHAKQPFQYGSPENFTHQIDAYNPLCGDKFSIFLTVENGVIRKASFTGFGCSISKASTSVLTKKIQGASIIDLLEIAEIFLRIIDENESEAADQLTSDEELLSFSAARMFPERHQCASLSWSAMQSEFSD